MRVLIDAGHGVDTLGKRSPDGSLREWLYNREIASLLSEELYKKGIPYTLIVTENNDVPLKERARRINEIASKEKCLSISIHANASGDGSEWKTAQGWECWTTPGQNNSDKLAEHLYNAMSMYFPDRKIRRDMSDGDSDKEGNLYMCKAPICPSVLVENWFYDNLEESMWMREKKVMRKIAEALAEGIECFIYEME